jgi:hypothetical protein
MKVSIKQVDKDEFQKKLALRAFLDSAGMKNFQEELGHSYARVCNDVERIEANSITADDLSKLNYTLGVKSGLKEVLQLLTNMKEELEDNSPKDEA